MIRSFVQKGGQSESGVVAVLFAIAIVPIMLLVGAAVDYSRMSVAHAAAQAAADAAANDPAASIELVGTAPAGALARFRNGYADGVIGGRFSTLPYFVASKIGRSRLIVASSRAVLHS